MAPGRTTYRYGDLTLPWAIRQNGGYSTVWQCGRVQRHKEGKRVCEYRSLLRGKAFGIAASKLVTLNILDHIN
jgi:hypothetical protein